MISTSRSFWSQLTRPATRYQQLVAHSRGIQASLGLWTGRFVQAKVRLVQPRGVH